VPPSAAARSGQPTVSALIVSWNSLSLIKSCLESLGKQTLPPQQVVVVDNGSTDGSVDWLREQPDLELIESKTNLGFAAANNLGLTASRGSAVLCLNPDVVLDPGYIELCLGHLARPDVGSVTGKLLRATPAGVIDSAGHAVYGIGWAENRGELSPDGPSFDQAQEVFGVCAAAGLYRAAALQSVRIEGQVFDETFFSYIEDVDLDWRLRWAGWRAWYEPQATAIHHRSATGARFSARIMRHILKNRLLTVAKNYDRSWLLTNGVGLAAFTMIKAADFGRRHPSAPMGLVDFARLLPEAVRKRRAIRSLRRTPSAEMRGWLLRFPWRERALRRVRGERGA
jgi:GT2 family glycosyltransferase